MFAYFYEPWPHTGPGEAPWIATLGKVKILALTRRECILLECFAGMPDDAPVSDHLLSSAMLAAGFSPKTSYLRSHVCRLNKKLAQRRYRLERCWQLGYKLVKIELN